MKYASDFLYEHLQFKKQIKNLLARPYSSQYYSLRKELKKIMNDK